MARYAHDVSDPFPRLTARSVIASTLLGVDPPRLPTRSLVRTAELLDINPGTTRVAVSRMVAAGELEPDGDGYRLASPALLGRAVRQAQSRHGITLDWDGTWSLVVVTADSRTATERTDLRNALTSLRHAELREGVWLRPDNLPDGILPAAESIVERQCRRFLTRPDEAAVALAERLWPLRAWATEAEELLARLDHVGEQISDDGPDGLGAAFVLGAAVLRHLQADPLLPAELLPTDWPGPELRRRQDDFDQLFKARLRTWLQTDPPVRTGRPGAVTMTPTIQEDP